MKDKDEWAEAWKRLVESQVSGDPVTEWLNRGDRVLEEGLRIAEKHNLITPSNAKSARESFPIFRDFVGFITDTVKTAVDANIGPVTPVGVPEPHEPPKPAESVPPMPQQEGNRVAISFIVVGDEVIPWMEDMVKKAAKMARRHNVALLGGETIIDKVDPNNPSGPATS